MKRPFRFLILIALIVWVAPSATLLSGCRGTAQVCCDVQQVETLEREERALKAVEKELKNVLTPAVPASWPVP